MAIFSPKARQLIEAAVAQLPDDFQRQTWRAWSLENPDVRRAGEPDADMRELPIAAAVVALGALDRMKATLTLSLGKLDEEDALDAEGDISVIKAIEAMLIKGLYALQDA
jgi:hypothetical protein